MNFDFNYYPRINKDKIILNIYFIDLDLDAYYFFVINNDFSKRHETKIDEGAWEDYQLHENRTCTSKKTAPKWMTFHLF